MKSDKRLALFLCLVLLLSLCLPTLAAGEAETPFRYEHDPRLNPSAMADIVVDPAAVYGFAPSREGSLAAYADFDWSDPALVNGENGRLARIAYHESLAEMYMMLEEMRAAGASAEEIARAVSTKRNELRLAAYDGDPEGLAVAKARNLEKYGHEEGPLPEELYEKYGSWEAVIEKAFSVNSGMDACLGLYDDYYELYVASGQVEPESSAAATREYAIAAFAEAAGLALPDSDEGLNAWQDAGNVSPWFRSELAAAVSAGILKGYPDGTLRPDEPITLAEALVLLSRCLPELEAKREPIAFTDVPAWAKQDVDRLSGAGLVEGCGDGRLGAGELLTVAQAVLLAQRISDLGTEGAVLPLRTSDAPAGTAPTDETAAITDEESPDCIPVSDRIAANDMDGAVFCGTSPACRFWNNI